MADELIMLSRHIREERGATVTDGVREALDRSARDFAEYVARTDFDAHLEAVS